MSDEVIELARQEMDGAVNAFRHELSRVRTGRASTGLLEGLQVNYYGAKTPLRQLQVWRRPSRGSSSSRLTTGERWVRSRRRSGRQTSGLTRSMTARSSESRFRN